MNDRNVRSSEIESARELSRRLSGRGPTSPSPTAATSRYVAFRRLPATSQASEAGTATPTNSLGPGPQQPALSPPPRVAPEPVFPALGSWEHLLAWCSESTGCRSAVVVDSQGFVVARIGSSSAEESEGLAAELSLAMEQLSHIDVVSGELRSAALEFGSLLLLAFRSTVRTESFVLGMLAEGPLTPASRAAVSRSFAEVVAKLG